MSESGRFPCPKDCGCAYEPVCGFNPCEEEHPNHMFRTFHNKCELENTICDGPGHCKYYSYLCVRRVVSFYDPRTVAMPTTVCDFKSCEEKLPNNMFCVSHNKHVTTRHVFQENYLPLLTVIAVCRTSDTIKVALSVLTLVCAYIKNL